VKAFDFVSASNSVPIINDVKEKEKITPKRTLYARGGKRALDLLLTFLLLPLFAPIIAVLWLFTRLDGGPGFYSQQRIGLNGEMFKCWKIRTMVMDAETVLQNLCDSDPSIAEEWLTNQKLAKDPRITRIGVIMRATSLDELPQIWNVLVGNMSFIGPRPFMTSQEHLYRRAGGESYFHMRPGITGPWQVDGRGVTTFVDRIRYDNEYLQTLSLRGDLYFVLKTVQVVLRGTGH
jgi:exopolysaccharide production protein ExoY